VRNPRCRSLGPRSQPGQSPHRIWSIKASSLMVLRGELSPTTANRDFKQGRGRLLSGRKRLASRSAEVWSPNNSGKPNTRTSYAVRRASNMHDRRGVRGDRLGWTNLIGERDLESITIAGADWCSRNPFSDDRMRRTQIEKPTPRHQGSAARSEPGARRAIRSHSPRAAQSAIQTTVASAQQVHQSTRGA